MTNFIPRFSLRTEATSLEALGAILEQSHDCIKIIGPDGSLDFMNHNGRDAMQVDDFAALEGCHWGELWPEESAPLVRNAIAQAQAGESSSFEAYCPTAKGEPRWWHVSVAPLKSVTGEVSAILSISRDISDQVRNREANTAVASEMRHRVRNAYALSAALARSLARGNEAAEDFADELGLRLSHLGEAQNLLLDVNENAPLADLMTRLVDIYQGGSEVITLGDMPDILLNQRQVQGLALSIGELSTNSHKYGALKHGLPVRVAAKLEGDDVVLVWTEEAQRAHEKTAVTSSGQGKELMRRFLNAIGGTMQHEWGNRELNVFIRFPVTEIAAAAA